jgi:para-nitrobenzyl esterase
MLRNSGSQGRAGGTRVYSSRVQKSGEMPVEDKGGDMQKPIVKTSGGLLEGFEEDGVFKFYGVPYAAAPVGKLRWRPPQRVRPWAGIRKADRFGPVAYQIRPPGPLDRERMPVQSEDCLYLNIWVRPAPAGEKMPVMVWIHGGGFMVGSGSRAVYDGAALARKGVVLVTFNYRLGPLGNLVYPGLEAESGRDPAGNYGIRDQIAALQWVKNNIDGFGGYRDNVTIFGESSGAMSTALLCSSPETRGLFSQAACQSGGLLAPPREIPYQEALRDGLEFQKALGAAGVAEMRHIPPERLIEVAGQFAGQDEQPNKLRFAPALDDVLVKDHEKTLKEKAGLPMIIGSNKDEANYFRAMMPPITLGNYERFVKRSFGGKAPRVMAAFPASSDGEALNNALFLHTCNLFTVPVYNLAGELSKRGGAVFVYRFNRESPKNVSSGLGASHGEEIPYIFGNLDTEGYAEADRKISETMMDYWVQFSKNGDPNAAGLPRWPRFSASANKYLAFDDEISTRNYAGDIWFSVL